MNIAYINISRSNVRDIRDLKNRQWHSVLYKQELALLANVYYVLRNSNSFTDNSSNLKITSVALGVPAFLWYVFRFIIKNKIQVVIIHNLGHFLFVPFFKMIPGLKVVLQHHGEPLFLHKKAFLMRFSDLVTDGYFFHGEGNALPFVKKKCLSFSKVHEIPEGTTDFKQVPLQESKTRRLIFIGRLDKNKNLIILLRALVSLKDHDFKLQVYFSDGGLLKQMQDFCAINGLSEKVTFMGKVSPAEIEKSLQLSDIFISCSKYEGSGYSLIEALACGVFPVVSDIAPFRYLLNGLEHSRLFSPESEEQLTKCLREIMGTEISMEIRSDIRRFFEDRVSPAAVAGSILKSVSQL